MLSKSTVIRGMNYNVSAKVNRIIGISVFLVGLIWLLLSQGCSTPGAGVVKPTAEGRAAAVNQTLDDCQEWLESHQAAIEGSLVIGGDLALNSLPPEERESVVAEMWAASIAFDTLATGKNVTVEQLNETMAVFAPRFNTKKLAPYRHVVVDAWGMVSVKLGAMFKSKVPETVQKATKLAVSYALLFSRAAQRVAARHSPGPPSEEAELLEE